MKALYTAVATATDKGRNGHVTTDAMRSSARRADRESVVDGSHVTAEVDIGRSGADGKFGLAVRLHATVPQLSHAEAEELVAKAHERCPYSNATRGNIEVELIVKGGG